MEQKKSHSAGFVMAVMNAWASTIYIFMRQNMGSRHPGISLWLGVFWIVLWMGFNRVTGLQYMIALIVVGSVLERIKPKKANVHSNYAGDSVLVNFGLFKNQAVAKRAGEPFIAFLFGLWLLWCGYEEGKYFTFGAVAMAFNQALIEIVDRRRVQDVKDAVIEGQYLMDQVKGK